MRKYELSISPNYVPTWTLFDAIRELLQNAYDEEKINPANKVHVEYLPNSSTLIISNDYSILDTSSLLLGMSTKATDTSTVGKFGEGYKLAALVLCRLGKKLEIFNIPRAELWQPRFVNSKRYGTQVLTFFVEQIEQPKRSLPQLIFAIHDISPEDYNRVVTSNLHLNKPEEVLETPYGQILLDKDKRGNVYIDGLYVCHNYRLVYGYNVMPEYLPIDRDRRVVGDFDLVWLTSKMFVHCNSRLLQLLEDGSPDVEYAYVLLPQSEIDLLYSGFLKKYGINAVPVVTQADIEFIPSGYKPIIVPKALFNCLKRASAYRIPQEEGSLNLLQRLSAWYDKARQYLPEILNDEFETLYTEISQELKQDE